MLQAGSLDVSIVQLWERLGYIRDCTNQNFIRICGIILSHCKDSYEPITKMKCHKGCEPCGSDGAKGDGFFLLRGVGPGSAKTKCWRKDAVSTCK